MTVIHSYYVNFTLLHICIHTYLVCTGSFDKIFVGLANGKERGRKVHFTTVVMVHGCHFKKGCVQIG